jgi:PAS domain S-box-containing protein
LGGAAQPAGFDASLWYRTLFAQSALGVTLADGQRRLIDCNDAFCRILGRSREELLGRRFYEFNVPGDEDVGGPAIAELISGAATFSYEKRYLRADGTPTWVRINLSVLSREDDLYAGIIEDISERKRAEAERALALAELRETTDLLARAHEVAKLGTFVVDTRSRMIVVSRELARMLAAGDQPFEISVEEYRRTFVHPDDREWSASRGSAGLPAATAKCSGRPRTRGLSLTSTAGRCA